MWGNILYADVHKAQQRDTQGPAKGWGGGG